MSEPTPSPGVRLYRVEASGLVDRALDALEERAAAAGAQERFHDALDRIYEILRIYPQFGDVMRELVVAGKSVLTSRGLVVPPHYVEYILDEENWHVIIMTPLRVLARSGFE